MQSYAGADAQASRQLYRDAERVKGSSFAVWALAARSSFVSKALCCRTRGECAVPGSKAIRDAVRDYLQVLREVYGSLVLDPYILEDAALQEPGVLLGNCCRGTQPVQAPSQVHLLCRRGPAPVPPVPAALHCVSQLLCMWTDR